ncbi:DDE-type integrase/transposase/recombinase, partial [Lacticaseibacillus paracasei]
NLIEQDHRFIKRHRVRSASFQSIRTASATLSGVEIVHAIRKRVLVQIFLADLILVYWVPRNEGLRA